MRHRTLRLWGLIAALIVVSLALSACGMVDDMLGSSDSMEDSSSMDDSANAPAAQAAQAEQAAQTNIDPAIAALLPGEPAPAGSDFRSDSAQVVGATGRPQLLEFFTYW